MTSRSGHDAVAFYLPQYHPTPENDAFWGKGFTEWRLVTTARPLYPGHYQPHVPADLGYYDLRVPEVRREQTDMAADAGFAAFCFYHYWFEGRQLLHRPVDDFFADEPSRLKYLLCWANESWTMVWHGRDQHVTIEQTYSDVDDVRHAEDLVRFLADERYYRLEGRPVLLLYRPEELPGPAGTIRRFRDVFAAHGLDVLLGSCSVFDEHDPRQWGMDFMVRWAPNWLEIGRCFDERLTKLLRVEDRLLSRWRPRFRHDEAYSYTKVVDSSLAWSRPAWPTAESVFPSWDNSPRRQKGDALIFAGSTPVRYEAWLRGVMGRRRTADPALVFVNAWNEWAEGCHLEPCVRWGHAWLDATRRALDSS